MFFIVENFPIVKSIVVSHNDLTSHYPAQFICGVAELMLIVNLESVLGINEKRQGYDLRPLKQGCAFDDGRFFARGNMLVFVGR
jgi:hypothetical protein